MTALARCPRCGTAMIGCTPSPRCATCSPVVPATPPAPPAPAAPWLYVAVVSVPVGLTALFLAVGLMLARQPARPSLLVKNPEVKLAARQGKASLRSGNSVVQEELPAPRLAPSLVQGGSAKPVDSPVLPGIARSAPAPELSLALRPAEKPVRTFLRRNKASEEELRLVLAGAEEVGLGSAAQHIMRTYTSHLRQTDNRGKGAADVGPLLSLRPDLWTLPLQDGPACTLGPKAAQELDVLSRKMRLYLNAVAPQGRDGRRPNLAVLRDRLHADRRGKKLEWLRVEAVPTLMQMLMAEDASTRRILIELLAAIPEKQATVALAQRAVFDLSDDVRAAAVAALQGRNPRHWRPVLLAALRYPWTPPADFAAEALVHLQDRAGVAELIALLEEPPPGRPYVTPSKRILIREVVKINHLTNCLLCHAPAVQGNEPVVGVDPVLTIPVQIVTQNPTLISALQQFNSQSGGYDYNGRARGINSGTRTTVVSSRGRSIATATISVPVLARADITFLRQDFSVSLPGTPPTAIPVAARRVSPAQTSVRFDYVVRTRAITASERKRWQALDASDSPQRDATLFALRSLTEEDHGAGSETWTRAFPLARAEVRAARLADRLVRANVSDRGALLNECLHGSGVEYTEALRQAIPRLSGPAQEVARRNLTRRLARLPSTAQLRQQLARDDAEGQRTAILACVEKNDRELAPALLPLLHGDATTAALARAALRKMTGQYLTDPASWRSWLTGVARATR